MTDCNCTDAFKGSTDAQIDLLLQSGALDELAGRVRYIVDRNVVNLLVAGPAIGLGAALWLAHLHADRAAAFAVIALGLLCIPAALWLTTISLHKPARPGYIMAALRSIASGHRRALLDQLRVRTY